MKGSGLDKVKKRSDGYTVHYSKSEKAETGIVRVMNKSTVRSDVKKTVCNVMYKIKSELVFC